jgi:glucose uptake protein GlcU
MFGTRWRNPHARLLVLSLSPVLQSYKIGICFLTCWLVLLVNNVPFSLSPYGLISGLLMVPGGTAGYYGVRNAGLAVSQGIWSSLKVLVAFSWGLFIFHEAVRSRLATALAIALLLVGLAGMSYYASSNDESTDNDDDENRLDEPLLVASEEGLEADPLDLTADYLHMNTRYLGILGAVIDGAYGGSVLVPMHFAALVSADLQGLGYLISFGVGCFTVLLGVWGGRWALSALQTGSCTQGWRQLPSFHVTTIGPYAALAGLIWSVGNVSSLVSVAMLGQGLGYSLVQCQLVIAGLWAVFFYGEIQGRARILGWFACVALTLVSILLLTQQHAVMPNEPMAHAVVLGAGIVTS